MSIISPGSCADGEAARGGDGPWHWLGMAPGGPTGCAWSPEPRARWPKPSSSARRRASRPRISTTTCGGSRTSSVGADDVRVPNTCRGPPSARRPASGPATILDASVRRPRASVALSGALNLGRTRSRFVEKNATPRVARFVPKASSAFPQTRSCRRPITGLRATPDKDPYVEQAVMERQAPP
jgi:hypothetical protein